MPKPVVLIAEELSPATIEALGPDFDVRNVDGTDREALFASLAEADAVLIRSATRIDEEALSHAPQLKVVARAGVGLDNVDIKAATAAGVMVVNAPTSNIVSAAELTIGHILSLARRIPAAHASLSAGQWKRSSYTGAELFEKTVGIIGLGRIGALVAARLAAFDMRVVAYDPYVTSARAQQLGVQLLSLDELIAESDFITIHMPKTPETTGMLSTEQFQAMKKTAYVVNVARGGLIDEAALIEALNAGEIAGAGLDVFTSEPPAEGSSARALTALPNVVVTPHLGASTDEAQEKAGVSVARSVRLALGGDLVPDAVNVAGGVIDPYVRPGISLVEKLGQIFSALATSPLTSLDVEVHGELNDYDVSVLKLAALKGVFTNIVSETVSYVNAPLLADQRGIAVRLLKDDVSDEYRNVITLRGALSDGTQLSVSGTLTGPKQTEKLVGINDHALELPIEKHHVVMLYTDRPGIVAVYGQKFGEAGINIAGMQIGRLAAGDQALSVLTLDSPVSEELLDDVRTAIDADLFRQIELTEV
ncbi:MULTISPECIES: phosphoglycerate dehydrogenase [unclassified Microbacterium]|uniref:phosphoglycerate dehydrogenase n=1 Tax=unclassified Microbacterium TaxID=2609290 RepID=UPI000CFD1838|nr:MULTISPECIES: phosphoglycerate dehydrogenase [unclassified Microbacterium]PRB10932.1 phosphoglycerate dehydrogenase [Microbacterium sp. MYb72]